MVDLFSCIPGSVCCCLLGDRKTAEMHNKNTKAKVVEAEGESIFSSFMHRFKQYKSPLTALVADFYSPFLQNYIVKVVVIVVFSILFGVCVWGCTKVEDGLNIEDVVPEGTVEHSFASANVRHFAAYPFTIVTKDIDYSDRQVQKALLQMSKEVKSARYVLEAGRLTALWLELMIDFFDGIERFYRNAFCMAPRSMQFEDFVQVFFGIHKYLNVSIDNTELMRLIGQSCITNNNITLRPLVEKEGNDTYIPSDRFYQYVPLWVSVYEGIVCFLNVLFYRPHLIVSHMN